MKGFRTLIFNGLSTILPILESLNITEILDERTTGLYILAVAIGNAILRFLTNTAVGAKN